MNPMRARLTPIAAALASGLFSLHAAPAAAATITVSASCSLQDAVIAANTDSSSNGCPAGDPGLDTIELPVNSTQTFNTAQAGGDPDSGITIRSPIVINGHGSTITRTTTNPAGRLVRVVTGGDLTLNDITLTGGRTNGGGGGAGILNNHRLTLNRCTVSGNLAGGGGFGGGLSDGQGNATLNDTMVSGNAAAIGGGIFNNRTLVLTNSTVSGNTSSFEGGGFFNNGGLGAVDIGTITLTNSTVSGNTAGYSGGGFFNSGSGATNAILTLIDSTVSGNSASDDGGGLLSAGHTTLIRSLISGNTASTGRELARFATSPDKFTGSISVNNRNLFGHAGESNVQAFSGFTPAASDFNATSDGGGGTHTSPTGTPLASILNPLADNGGPTRTQSLPDGSPAVNAAGSACTATDQRGVNRPKSSACDIGAYEVGRNTANLSIVKTRSASSVLVGDPLTYTLTVFNVGPDTATAVQVVDPLPAQVSYVSASPVAPATGDCVYDASFRTVTCQLGNLALNRSVAVRIATTAISPGLVTNTGSTLSDLIDVDPDTRNNAFSVQVQINPADTAPDAFGFNPASNVTPGSTQTSNTITPSGYNRPAVISVDSNSSYSIGCANAGFTGAAGVINPGESVCVRHTASSSFSTPVTTTLTIGGVQGSFTSTTQPAPTGDTTPDRFKITAAAEVEPNSVNTSSVRITGIDVPTPVSVSGGGGMYSVAGGGFTSAPGFVTNGQTITLQLVAPPNYNARSAMTLTVGTYSDDYKLTTRKLPK